MSAQPAQLVPLAPLVVLDLKVHKVHKVHKVQWVHKVVPERKGLLDLRVIQVRKAQQDPQDLRAQPEPQFQFA